MSRPWVGREHPMSCSGWIVSDAMTDDRICDCGLADESNGYGLMQHDMALLLKALGLGDHARPDTPHVVMHDVILPAVRRLAGLREVIAEAIKDLRDGASEVAYDGLRDAYNARWDAGFQPSGHHADDR